MMSTNPNAGRVARIAPKYTQLPGNLSVQHGLPDAKAAAARA
jgi:hypothetical protein